MTFARGCILCLGLTLLLGCGRQGESALVIYSAGPRPLIEQIAEDFSKTHNIPVRLFVATTGQLMAKLEAERFRPQADVVIFASDVAAEALRSGDRLAPLTGLTLPDTHADWHDPNGYYLATSAALVGVALGREQAQLAPDWPQLFSGDFPGRVAMPSPSRSGTAGDFVVSRVLERGDEAWQQFTRARAGGMEFPAANSQALTSLMIGNYQAIALSDTRQSIAPPAVIQRSDVGAALREQATILRRFQYQIERAQVVSSREGPSAP